MSQIKIVIMMIEIRVWDWRLELGDWNLGIKNSELGLGTRIGD